jgi:hypothetical protein
MVQALMRAPPLLCVTLWQIAVLVAGKGECGHIIKEEARDWVPGENALGFQRYSPTDPVTSCEAEHCAVSQYLPSTNEPLGVQ